MLWTNQVNSLETQIEHLLPILLGRDLSYIHMFLGAYRVFATTQDVLDLLFAKEFWTTEKKTKTKTSCLLALSLPQSWDPEQMMWEPSHSASC
uniref:N-terminal Ras-GEF domain-containing protein n=1 Tax=Mustela putorius furo TaxID=9669 RepID=M3YKH2_MUSPF